MAFGGSCLRPADIFSNRLLVVGMQAKRRAEEAREQEAKAAAIVPDPGTNCVQQHVVQALPTRPEDAASADAGGAAAAANEVAAAADADPLAPGPSSASLPKKRRVSSKPRRPSVDKALATEPLEDAAAAALASPAENGSGKAGRQRRASKQHGKGEMPTTVAAVGEEDGRTMALAAPPEGPELMGALGSSVPAETTPFPPPTPAESPALELDLAMVHPPVAEDPHPQHQQAGPQAQRPKRVRKSKAAAGARLEAAVADAPAGCGVEERSPSLASLQGEAASAGAALLLELPVLVDLTVSDPAAETVDLSSSPKPAEGEPRSGNGSGSGVAAEVAVVKLSGKSALFFLPAAEKKRLQQEKVRGWSREDSMLQRALKV